MNDTDLAVAADENLASTWAVIGRSIGADVVEDGPLTLVATGVPMAFFNGAYLRASTSDPERTVAEAVRFFAERDLPWLLWVRDGVCPAILDVGRSSGLRDAGGPPAMGLTRIAESPPPPEGLRIEIATTEAALRDHASMLRDGFGLPQAVIDRIVAPALLDVASAAVLVGRVAGEPVSCSLVAISGAIAGIYNVATPERFRGRGYGEALTWAAVTEGARRGCSHAVLQASESGYPIYRRMGFVDLGRYVQLEGPP